MDFGAIYAETRGRITELTGGLSQDQLERDVPATPEWCVRDAVAHLVGVAKRNFVRLVPGDRVEVELAPHDPTRGRITRKLSGA